MTAPATRPLSMIDGEIRSILCLNRDAAEQLDSIRRQISELQNHELNLMTAVEGRRTKIDRLLDERQRRTRADA